MKRLQQQTFSYRYYNNWKNHFSEMKGDVEMSLHKKEGEQVDATPKQKLMHNPIPTDTAGTIDTFSTKSMLTKRNNKQRCRDEVMNEFLFWCRHPLVRLLFHEVTSLHPPSFQRNDFSTCSTYFSVSSKAPIKMRCEDIAN